MSMEMAEHGTTRADAAIAPELGKALLLAQQIADETLADARREAARIIADAQRQRSSSGEAPGIDDVKPLLDACIELEQTLTAELEGSARRLYALRVKTGERMTELRELIGRLDHGRG
jgi:cell division septum initiation protein DivIVA